MKNPFLICLLAGIFLFACGGTTGPSDQELENIILNTLKKDVSPLNILAIPGFANSKIIEVNGIENLKRASWKGGKQKFKCDVKLEFLKGMKLPSFTDRGDDKKLSAVGNEMIVELEGYLLKDEYDDWVIEVEE